MITPGNKKKCLMTQLESALRARSLCQERLELLEEEILRLSSQLQALEKEAKK